MPVPDTTGLFDNGDTVQLFSAALTEYMAEADLPAGYGIREDELGVEGYETYEVLQIGKRGRKEMTISLPEQVWRPQTELWAKALHVMSYLIYSQSESH